MCKIKMILDSLIVRCRSLAKVIVSLIANGILKINTSEKGVMSASIDLKRLLTFANESAISHA